MRGLKDPQQWRSRCMACSDQALAIARNRLHHRSQMTERDWVWMTDLYPIWMLAGRAHLAAVLDLLHRKLSGYTMAGYTRTELVRAVLEPTGWTLPPVPSIDPIRPR